MKEYMFYIRNTGDAKAALSAEKHLEFVKKCEVYIGDLKSKGKLIAAQPLVRGGIILSQGGNSWETVQIDQNKEVQVGYYHIMADGMDDAISIAMQNPEFEYVPSATIEIHEIKTKEEKTDFEYPK